MVDVIDTGAILGKQKSLRDFQVENALKNQAISEGDIKNANAQNLYRTQVLTGAIASGDPGIYKDALTHLGQRGIDVSDISPDINTGFQQVQAMRQAQYSANPLNAMLGLGLKAEGNLNSAAGTFGNAGAAAAANPLSAAIAGRVAGAAPGAPGLPAAPMLNSPVAQNPVPAAPNAMGAAPARGEPMPARADVSQALAGIESGAAPAPGGATAPPALAPQQLNPEGRPQVKFVPVQRQPGETEAAYQNRNNLAMQAFKEDPATIRAQSYAQTEGKDAGELPVKAAEAREASDRIDQNLDTLLQLNPNVPQSRWGISSQSRAYLSQNFGGQTDAQAYAGFTKVNKAQILNGIQELVNSGAIRTNRTLVDLTEKVNAIDENSSPDIRAQQIEQIRSEIHNLSTSAANVNATVNGGQRTPYENIPVSGKALKTPPPEMIKALREDPRLKDQFEQAYGSGAARIYLR